MSYRETPPTDQEATLRTYAMPKDTNGLGDIFGGWLMSPSPLVSLGMA